MSTISAETVETAPRHGIYRIIEPYLLFPILGIVITAIIWLATVNFIRIEREAAVQTAIATVRELTETYEAQVLRALREIDQELKLVRFTFRLLGEKNTLTALEQQELLPPAFLFTVVVLDPQGAVVASTGSLSGNIDLAELSAEHQHGDDLLVSSPLQNPESGEWTLVFSRPLRATGGDFAGVVAIEVDSAFFVSGYETSKLGEAGLLGVIGTDGVARAWRSGNALSAGDTLDGSTLVTDHNATETAVSLAELPLDNISRYLGARELFGFPLAVVVGLSRNEQMAPVVVRAETYALRAFSGNVLLLVVLGVLWRMSHKLAQSRRREVEVRLSHAKQVEYLAFHDGLTGLPNRSLFTHLLQQGISQAQRYDRKLAVLFLDLDRFKAVNDTLGHEAGDQLLKEVAERLKNCLRKSDTVARLGGDEFVVLLPELADTTLCISVAQKAINEVARPFHLCGQDFRVTVSIGISTYPEDGEDQETLTKNADIAMYHAKENGKNNYQLYSKKLHTESLQRLTLEMSLEHALERGEFQLDYQAKRDVHSKRITGMEALLRWHHPDLGVVAPMQFIPLAEETGFIIPIGKWVIKTACAQNVAWQQQGFPPLNMAINLTERQFLDPNLPEDIRAVLAETGLAANLLELEITESLLMRNVPKALEVMSSLKQVGVRIAIDDFGMGYSSLSMLRQFPLDTIKMDRTFIRNLGDMPANRALAEAIVAVGKNLSLTVVAQGVETREQADFLQERAYDEFQGFYFNKPVSAEEVTELLRGQLSIQKPDTTG